MALARIVAEFNIKPDLGFWPATFRVIRDAGLFGMDGCGS